MSRRWFTFLVCALIFLIPSNLFVSFATGGEYLHGLRVDYLIPKLYLSDCVILILIASVAVLQRKKIAQLLQQQTKRMHLFPHGVALFVIILFAARQFFTVQPLISVLALVRITMMIVLMFCLVSLRSQLKKSSILLALSSTVIFQSIVGLHQWLTQTPLVGYLLLGEPNIRLPLGLAKATWQGREMVLPYGTTAHPNILAGVIVVYLIAILLLVLSANTPKWQRWLAALTWLLGIPTLVATHSLSGWLALLVGCLCVYFSHRTIYKRSLSYIKVQHFLLISGIVTIATVVFLAAVVLTSNSSDASFVRRFQLNQAGITAFLLHPVMGVGLAHFTIFLDQPLSYEKAIVPFVQPAHTVPVLLMGEVAILGITAIACLTLLLQALFSSKRRQYLLGWFSPHVPILFFIFLPLAMLDHYLVTLQTGLLLVATAPLLLKKVED